MLLDSATFRWSSRSGTRGANGGIRTERHPTTGATRRCFEEALELAVARRRGAGRSRPGGPAARRPARRRGGPRRADLHRGRGGPHARGMFRPIRYGTEYEAVQGVHVTLLDAGHISSARRSSGCGSPDRAAAATRSSCSRAISAGPVRRSCATPPRSRTPIWYLCKSTYGGREHEAAEVAVASSPRSWSRRPAQGRPAHPVVRHRADPGDRVS